MWGLVPSKSSFLWCLFVAATQVTEGTRKFRTTVTEDEQAHKFYGGWGLTKVSGPAGTAAGPEPGDLAAAFTVPTLAGDLSYQPGTVRGSLVIHAFTNKSGFLECLWSSDSSLSSLVQDLPSSTQVLFVSLDDSAVSDALWMRRQLQRAAMHR